MGLFSFLMKRPCINQRVVVSLKGCTRKTYFEGSSQERVYTSHIRGVSPTEAWRREESITVTHADVLSPTPRTTLSKDSVLALASSLQAVSPRVCGRLYLPVISETNRWKRVSDEEYPTP